MSEPTLPHHVPTADGVLGFGLGWFGRRFFGAVRTGADAEAVLRKAQERGHVVHVMLVSSRLRFLYLVWLLARLGLPTVEAAVGLTWFLLRPWRWLRGGEPKTAFKEAFERGNHALVFLRRPTFLSLRATVQEDIFPELIQIARASDRPVVLVPELLVWERRPGSVKPGFWDALFGSPEAPSGLAQVFAFLKNHDRAFLRVGEPIDLTAFVESRPEERDESLARKVRSTLDHHLARQLRAIVGPKQKGPEQLLGETLRDRTFQSALVGVAKESGKPQAAVEAQARRNLQEIGARYSPSLMAGMRPVLAWLFQRIYDGVEVDEAGLERAMAASTRGALVFCPSHKSHIDYLLMAWIFLERGMVAPHAAAGANLSFFPLGTVFRRGGAYFLRRSFKGDKVYTAAFRAYVKKLLKEGVSQEFYIEGGRSRTGKLLNPKTGLLSFEVEAFLEGVGGDVSFVPVAIDYEKIVEAKSYEHELAGGEKQKEDVRGLLETPKVLAARYGRIHVGFGEPVSLSKFLAARGADADRRKSVAALAHRIVHDISRVSTTTPSALIAASLLAHRARGLGARAMTERIHFLRELVKDTGGRASAALGDAVPSDPMVLGPVKETLELFEADQLVTHQDVGGERIFQVNDARRLEVVFYKNTLMHLVAGRSLVAWALRSWKGEPAPLEELRERTRWLSRLFKLEFIYRVGAPFEALFEENVAGLEARGLVIRRGETLVPAPEKHAQEMLGLLGELVRDFTESYLVAAKSCAVVASGPKEKKELVTEMLAQGKRAFLDGSIQSGEAVTRPNFENALELFVELGWLAPSGKSAVVLGEEGKAQLVDGQLARDIGRFLP